MKQATYQTFGFWPPRTLWKLAWRAARSGYGVSYFRVHGEFYWIYEDAKTLR